MAEISKLNYPSSLLKIESRQQLKRSKTPLIDENSQLSKQLMERVNEKIYNVIKENKTEKGKIIYTVDLPDELMNRIENSDIRKEDLKEVKQITPELSALQVRILTAIVGLAEVARLRKDFQVLPKIKRGYFETTMKQILEALGLNTNWGSRDLKSVSENLERLYKKNFVYYDNGEYFVGPLVRIEGIRPKNTSRLEDVLKLTIAPCFNYKSSGDKSYFHVPYDLNKRLRSVTKGRPNASVELLVKYLYQSKHCTNSNYVEYNYGTLYSIMNLNKYVKNKNYPRIKKTLNKAFQTCKDIGLVNKIEEGKNSLNEPKYIFYFSKHDKFPESIEAKAS